MARKFERLPGGEHSVQILSINGAVKPELAEQTYPIMNISKGGFCFCTELDLQLEDRLKVQLTFPDGHSQEVLGRICYSQEQDDGRMAYGYSVLDGFYSMHHAA